MTKQEILRTCIDMMFFVSNHNARYDDIKDLQDEWYLDYTWTSEQEKEWLDWASDFIHEKTNWSKLKARQEAGWLLLNFGLKTKP